MSDPIWPPTARPPFLTDIADPVLVDPPPGHLTKEGVYIPPTIRPHIKLKNDPQFSHIRQLYLFVEPYRVKRWELPSWGWVGVRTYFGHSNAEWEEFRRKVVGAYWLMDTEEGEKFRIIWIEDKEKVEGADDDVARKAFENWYLDHSEPPDGYDSLIPTMKKVWSGYEENVCLVADKEVIDSVLADTSGNLDETAFIKLLDRRFHEGNMRKWAPKLVGRYTGLFKVSPYFLPHLSGIFDEDASYGELGHASAWYLKTLKTQDGVFRQKNYAIVDEDFEKDPVNLGADSSDEDSEDRCEDPDEL